MTNREAFLTKNNSTMTKRQIAAQLVAQSDIRNSRQKYEAIERIVKHKMVDIESAMSYMNKGVTAGFVVRVLTGILCN